MRVTKVGLLKAIKENCLTCLGSSKKEIKGCSSTLCKLKPYRPFQDWTPKAKK